MSQLSIYITSAWLCLILCMVRRRGRIAGMRHKQSSWILLPEIWMAAQSNCLMSLSPLHLFSLSISLALLRSALSPSLCLSGCKVIKLSCFILDAIQRSDTLESWLWHALATHTHLHRSAQHRHRCAEDKWVLCLCSQSRVVQRSDYQTGGR